MRKLTLTLVFTVMFSSTSFAEWKGVSQSVDKEVRFYVDFERIRKHDGYVYFWVLEDYSTIVFYESLLFSPLDAFYSSTMHYNQGDCNLFRFKELSFTAYKEQMGQGQGEELPPWGKWIYANPKSNYENVLKTVCEYVN